jgi:NADH-quinone oxidoreductase subunit C
MSVEKLEGLKSYLEESLRAHVESAEVAFGELSVMVKAASIVPVMSFLHDDARCAFRILQDVCGCDYPQRMPRFEVVYHLLSVKHNQRIRVKLRTDDEAPVDSIVSVYPAAGWYEREVWDMYGIYFANNPDLRRILTDYGFDGHPLRKDFPLTGYVEMRYDEVQKRVVYEPVKLTQEFRTFDYLSPWEGPNYTLPGDEKAEDPMQNRKGAA